MAKGIRWIVLGVLLLSACNYQLDTRQIEADIKADIERQGRRVTLNDVICPNGVAKQAEAYFRCVGELASGEIFTINVIQQDDEGAIAWDVPSSKTLINLVSLEAEMQKKLSQLAGQRVEVSCDGAYRVNERGDAFECDIVGLVATGTDRLESVLVRVGAEGDVSWQEVRLPVAPSPAEGTIVQSGGTAARPAPNDAVAANPVAESATTNDTREADPPAEDDG